MSGVMIKIGIYGMLRVFFQFLHPIDWWWGLAVLILAALTAVVGVGNAIRRRDLKESLADHSVENIGIILAGIGLALIFAAREFGPGTVIHGLAGLALAASLYHLLNHAVFKGLLFLATGAIDYLTGTVEMEKLGGLIHRFRWTAASFLVGSVAIAGFPPFNGFISEWLTLQVLFTGARLFITTPLALPLLLGIILSGMLLVTAFAMTALAFVKIAGETLLGAPRDNTVQENEKQRDVPWRMRGVMLVLAAVCLVLGIAPWQVLTLLGTVTSTLGFPLASVSAFSSIGGITIDAIVVEPPARYVAHLRPEFLFALLTLVSLASFLAARTIRFRRENQGSGVEVPVWTCGTPYHPQTMQYTSSAYTFLVRDTISSLIVRLSEIGLFRWLGAWIANVASFSLEDQIEVSPGRITTERFRRVYNVLIHLIERGSQSVGSMIQKGDLRSYLLYMFVIFIVVLLVLVGQP